MFHYLIERFQQVKKLHQKTTASDATIENLQVRLHSQTITVSDHLIGTNTNPETANSRIT